MKTVLSCPNCGGVEFFQRAIPEAERVLEDDGLMTAFDIECHACGEGFELSVPPDEAPDLIDLGPVPVGPKKES